MPSVSTQQRAEWLLQWVLNSCEGRARVTCECVQRVGWKLAYTLGADNEYKEVNVGPMQRIWNTLYTQIKTDIVIESTYANMRKIRDTVIWTVVKVIKQHTWSFPRWFHMYILIYYSIVLPENWRLAQPNTIIIFPSIVIKTMVEVLCWVRSK